MLAFVRGEHLSGNLSLFRRQYHTMHEGVPGTEPSSGLTWWSDVSPSLMANRTIRNFLVAYSDVQHPEVVKLTMLYGILSLQAKLGSQPPAIGEIRKMLKEGHLGQTLATKLTSVKDSVNDIQHVLHEMQDYAEGVEGAHGPVRLLQARVLQA